MFLWGRHLWTCLKPGYGKLFLPMAQNRDRKSGRRRPLLKAQLALDALGSGFDVSCELDLQNCRGSSRLVELDDQCHDLFVPPNFVLHSVSKDIRCEKGEQTRFKSSVLDFHQMSERFNQSLSLSGKVPSGHFTSMYNLKGPWHQDAALTKSLALDGLYITLYNLQITRVPLRLREEVISAVPQTWDPVLLARFIERYGTHVILSVKMGGKDVIYIRQHHSSSSSSSAPAIGNYLQKVADSRFGTSDQSDSMKARWVLCSSNNMAVVDSHFRSDEISSASFSLKNDVEIFLRRKGGCSYTKGHNKWLATLSSDPDVIAMSFVPITALLNGVDGMGFLSHAINLYLRYKPPIKDLRYFLDLQIPRRWSLHFEVPLEDIKYPALQCSLGSQKLYIDTSEVCVGVYPVTGLRFYLEERSFMLTIDLQHLCSLPRLLRHHLDNISMEPPIWSSSKEDGDFSGLIPWKGFCFVNVNPVEYIQTFIGDRSTAFIVTGARLKVLDVANKTVLSLMLQFLKLPGCSIRRSAWDHMPKGYDTASSEELALPLQDQLLPVARQNSAVFPGFPQRVESARVSRLIDTTEWIRGSCDSPGHWIVTGAKFDIHEGRLSVRPKYSLLHYS